MVSRDGIVAALASVPGLSPSRTKTGPISPFDAWPVWTGRRWVNAVPDGLRETSWAVIVALPDMGPDATALEADGLVEAVGMALIGAGLQVDQVVPDRTAVTETSPGVPILRYTVRD